MVILNSKAFPIAMAGLAEAAVAEALAICWAVLLIIAIVTFFAWLRTSLSLNLIAIAMLVGFSLLFQPWAAFEKSVEVLADPDAQMWQASEQFMALAWMIEVVIVSVATLRIQFLRRDQGMV